jgi:tRNA(adenine34) deaminase
MVEVSEEQKWMRVALTEAERAYEEAEVPVGAVVIQQGRILGRGHNRIERLHDPTAHAEMIAISAAAESLGYPRLNEASIYVTIEPCTMCAGAIVLARLKRLIYGAKDPKAGACGSLYDITGDSRLNHRVEVVSGVLEAECSQLLSDFFKKLRSQGS